MKIFPTTSIKQLDADTIENEPIASIDLMERASRALARAIAERWEPDTPLTVFAGPGNNGGDALALARPQLLASNCDRLPGNPPPVVQAAFVSALFSSALHIFVLP